MSSMIERVAGAIAAESGQEWADCGVGYRQICTSFAIAAIKAMREPDKHMVHAAAKAMSPGRRPTPERVSVAEKHAIRYRAMLDAALTDTEKR